MSGCLLKFTQTYSVKIGGRKYPVVKIGNQLWMAENLDWKFDGCVIGSSDTSTTGLRGNYYNDDEATYGINGNKYGLLYNWPAAATINTLVTDGWKVPTVNDVNVLSKVLGTAPGTQLKSKTGWDNDGNGTDVYGFKGVPTGYRQTSFMGINTATAFWTLTEIGQYDSYARTLTSDNTNIGGQLGTNKGFRFAVRLLKFEYGTVTIGGRDYKTVIIGNQEWLAENLDYKFAYNGSTLPIGESGNPSTPSAWYYNNDETNYGIDGTYKCGLLYNWYAAKYLDDNKVTLLPNGWHVPTKNEWDTLSDYVGGASIAGTKLKTLDNSVTSSWPNNWNGTNDYGFSALPAGEPFNNQWTIFWTSTENNISTAYYRSMGFDITSLNVNNTNKTGRGSVRLVKTLT